MAKPKTNWPARLGQASEARNPTGLNNIATQTRCVLGYWYRYDVDVV
jgi:hypothetical protein